MSRRILFINFLAWLIVASVWVTCSFAADKEMTPLAGIPILEDIKPLKIGDKAPLFSVKDIEGKEFDIKKKLEQANYMFIFWSIFCEPCKEEMPLIKMLTDEYTKDKISIVAINLDGTPFKNAIVSYAKEGGYNFTFIVDELDEEEFFKIADPYGVGGTPTIYIIDKTGTVQFAEVGKVKRADLKKAIDSVVNK